MILEDFSPQALALANEANFVEFGLLRRAWRGCEVYEEPEMISMVTKIPAAFINRIFRARLQADTVDTGIEKALTRFKANGVPCLWYVGPTTTPNDFGKRLEAHGFVHIGDQPGMAIDLHSLNGHFPSPLEIKPVRNVNQLKEASRVPVSAFGEPGFIADAMLDMMSSFGFDPDASVQTYCGYLGGEPVAVSSIFYGAGVAGIYNVATLPEARRKGFGTAMVAAPLREARQKGYRVGILQSSEMGYGVYQKMGFQENCKMNLYVWQPGRVI
ncbi:MAG TPA: GNAT family N-acetyltransferase [Anaerolineales bacterium]|jgi:GNAT superfamily N-acetyltransferase|nr:GNAT family N-acetyltransferase [Anaerolineales bacterium]